MKLFNNVVRDIRIAQTGVSMKTHSVIGKAGRDVRFAGTTATNAVKGAGRKIRNKFR